MSMRVSLNNGQNRARWQSRLSILFGIFLVLVPPSHEPSGWSGSRSATDGGGTQSWWQPATGTMSRVARGKLCVSVAGGDAMCLSLPTFEVNLDRYGLRPAYNGGIVCPTLSDSVLVVCVRAQSSPRPLFMGCTPVFCFV